MRKSNTTFQFVALAFILSLASAVFAQDNTTSEPQKPITAAPTRAINDGQKLKVTGVVIKRDADSFTLREPDGTETVVALTGKTKVRMVRKGAFRADLRSRASLSLRGLRVEVKGRGNSDGQLVAAQIRFNEQDLRTAQALEARVDPVETLADSNQQRLTAAEENEKLMAGQIDEVSAAASASATAAMVAQASAYHAQASADQAQADANAATQRINGLDDYEVVETVAVHFKPGSAVLSPSAQAEIDEAAAKVQSEDLKGWLVEVVGYADSTGNTAQNRSLSERRTAAVINYLVTKYDLPLRRLVQPFAYGSLKPVADNKTREGRALNRRVEIRVLANKGVSAKASL
jgi:outer membrane protein OmpA-like peptidoglycan-associated protein